MDEKLQRLDEDGQLKELRKVRESFEKSGIVNFEEHSQLISEKKQELERQTQLLHEEMIKD